MLTAPLQELTRQLESGAPPLPAFKTCLQAGAADLGARFAAGEPVEQLVRARSDLVDGVLYQAWRLHIPPGADAALVAVGGYGRAELHPASDIDILVLCQEEPDNLSSCLEPFVTFLWDIGLEPGISARSVAGCVEQAEKEITIATNLMESRCITGDSALFEAMRRQTGPDRIWPSDRFFEAKWQEQQARHHKYDDSAYNLEPNLKENPGGLRDIQMIGWVAKRHFGARTMADLVSHGFLNDAEYRALVDGQSHLWRIRFALHLLTGRHEDRLLFEHQRLLARQFGYLDEDNNLAVEQFMQAYYRTVMRLNRLNEMLLQLFQEAILLHDQLPDPVRINTRFQHRGGYLEVCNEGIFARRPLAMLELFLLLQAHPELKGVRASTIRLLRAHRHLIDERFRRDIKARSLFVEILRQPRGITHQLRRMNRYGILARYLPEFSNIVGRMQFDLFHIYTVDEHTLMVVRNMRRFALPEFQQEFPHCNEVFATLPKPELLYMAGLYHDIAKGRGGDHSELGAEDALAFCKRHDLSDYDARLVSWLVRNHLLMSATAQRKDIEDPAVIQQFAAEVGDKARLDYLYLLTVADIRATNPQRWNSWKYALLRQLHTHTREALIRGLDNPQVQDELAGEKQEEARHLLQQQGYDTDDINRLWMSLNLEYFLQQTPEEIAWHSSLVLDIEDYSQPLIRLRNAGHRGCDEIFVCISDREHLFADSTAILDQLGLNILEARIQTTLTGFTMNSFFVLEEDGSHIEDGIRSEEIASRLADALVGTEPGACFIPRRISRQARQFTMATRVSFSQDEPNQRTLMQLNAMDRPGLLSRIGQVFSTCEISVLGAKITTVGAMAEDVFFITDWQQHPITDPVLQERLAQLLREKLDSPPH